MRCRPMMDFNMIAVLAGVVAVAAINASSGAPVDFGMHPGLSGRSRRACVSRGVTHAWPWEAPPPLGVYGNDHVCVCMVLVLCISLSIISTFDIEKRTDSRTRAVHPPALLAA